MKRYKKISLVVALCLVVGICAFSFCGCQSYDETLIIYNWEDYVYSKTDLQDDFNDYYYSLTGKTVKIKYSTFDTNETMLTKVLKCNAVADMVCPSEYAIQKLVNNGIAQKIDDVINANITDEKQKTELKSAIYSNVNNAIYDKVSEVEGMDINDYFVPYMMGTLGIMYNADLLADILPEGTDVEEYGWGLLWNKTSDGEKITVNLDGKIYMKDSIRDSYAAAVFYLKEQGRLPKGYENKSAQELINDTSAPMVEAVSNVLKEQKLSGCLKGYEVDFGKEAMISGTVVIDLAWSGDAMYAIEEAAAEGVTLDYFTPQSGSNIWFDGWIIPTTAQNPVAALYMMAFLNQPTVTTLNMMEIGYTSAVDKNVLVDDDGVRDVLLDCEYAEIDEETGEYVTDYFDFAVRYPDYSDETFGVMQDFGESNKALTAMWEEVLSSDTDLNVIWLTLGAIVLVVLVFLAAISVKNNRKRKTVKTY